MLSRLHLIQTPAYDAAGIYQPPATNSTSNDPPVHKIDLKMACEMKKKAVENLPTKCGHCGTPFGESNCVTELSKTGSVVAYCRGIGGCGKSQVLFVGVKTYVPHYRKVCVFKRKVEAPHQIPAPNFTHHPFPPYTGSYDIYILHGIIHPETLCEKCGQRYDNHLQGYDQNDWVIDGYDQLELPADWPVFHNGKFVANNEINSY